MAYFKTKNPNLGKFWRVLQWKVLVYFMAIWSILWLFGIGILWLFGIGILWPYGIDYGNLLHFPQFWYVLPRKIWQPCFKCQIFFWLWKNWHISNVFFPDFLQRQKNMWRSEAVTGSNQSSRVSYRPRKRSTCTTTIYENLLLKLLKENWNELKLVMSFYHS
jgi:hypothetical protein